MTPKQMLYDEMCRVLTDYEGNGSEVGASAGDLYDMLVKLQNRWEDIITSCEGETESRGSLANWLTMGTGSFVCKTGGYHNTIIRVRKNVDFDYIYIMRQYQSIGIERGDKFDYAGIYFKRDGLVYDCQYAVRDLFDDLEGLRARDAEVLHENLKDAVRGAVEAAVGNNRNNLRITVLPSGRFLEGLKQFQEYSAWSQARSAYLDSDDEDGGYSFTYKCNYSPKRWTEDSLLEYIINPDGYVNAETNAYIDSHQEAILSDFLESDMIAAEYKKIIDNSSDPVHCVKRIMQAVSASSAKTVKVTIRKNDIDFTFKTEAGEFRSDCTNYYSGWHIAAADRREFERLFGRNAHYEPEDILRIEYARSVLYEKEQSGGKEAARHEM